MEKIIKMKTSKKIKVNLGNKECLKIVSDFNNKISKSDTIDKDIQQIINENFWDML